MYTISRGELGWKITVITDSISSVCMRRREKPSEFLWPTV